MKINFKDIHFSIIKNCQNFPYIKENIQKNGILKVEEQNIDFFAFLTKTIISQQISDKVSQSIWNKFCYKFKPNSPSLKHIKSLKSLIHILEDIKISNKKKNYICNLYKHIKINNLNVKILSVLEEKNFRSTLTNYKGIGPWTCDMILIFFFNKLNILPKHDLIIKKIMYHIEKVEKKKIDFEKNFSPFLSILSLHFWKMSKRVL